MEYPTPVTGKSGNYLRLVYDNLSIGVRMYQETIKDAIELLMIGKTANARYLLENYLNYHPVGPDDDMYNQWKGKQNIPDLLA